MMKQRHLRVVEQEQPRKDICYIPDLYKGVRDLASEIDKSILEKDQIALEHLQMHARQLNIEIAKVLNRKL